MIFQLIILNSDEFSIINGSGHDFCIDSVDNLFAKFNHDCINIDGSI